MKNELKFCRTDLLKAQQWVFASGSQSWKK